MASSPNKAAAVQVSESLKGLTQEFFAARERCAADSFLLLQANQRFLKKLGDLKKVKDEVEIERNNFVDKATVYALRDAELRYQKACFLETEQEWADMIRTRHEEIKLLRSTLQEQLAHYCEERRKTSVLQGQVTQRTEEDRINALNSVAFCTYSQNIVEQEIKKLCATAVLPTQRNLQKTQQLLQQALQNVRKDTQQFHEEKIREFKRQERILFGRGRDASDLQPQQQQGRVLRSAEGGSSSSANGDNTNASNNPNSTNVDLMIDSLENRIALRLLSQTVAFDAHATTVHDEDAAHNHNPDEHDDYHRHAVSPSSYYPPGGPNALTASPPSYSMSRTGGTDGGGLADSGAFSITNISLSNNYHSNNTSNKDNSNGNAHTRNSGNHHHSHNQQNSAYARRSLRSTTYSQSSATPHTQPQQQQQRSRPSRRFSLLQVSNLLIYVQELYTSCQDTALTVVISLLQFKQLSTVLFLSMWSLDEL